MQSKSLVSAIMALILVPALSAIAQQGKPAANPRPAPPKSSKTAAAPQEDGERVFQQHCSRCHNAPDGFSSRISGTITMHMRVRASLSDQETKALLRFLNP